MFPIEIYLFAIVFSVLVVEIAVFNVIDYADGARFLKDEEAYLAAWEKTQEQTTLVDREEVGS